VSQAPKRCAHCGTELADSLLRCPSCGTLAHADSLTLLAARATQSQNTGDLSSALTDWQSALRLLPVDAPQHGVISGRIAELTRQLDSSGKTASGSPGQPRPTGVKGAWVSIGAAVLFLLGKAKFLLLGFTKLGTLLSMVAFFGVYISAYGWKFALGLVLSIYVHEMGHVASLRHYGIPASAPMFIPGIGALVRLKSHPPTPQQDARVGLAGPIWGTGAAIFCFTVFEFTGQGLYASLTHTGAVINLFNLIPVWQLDGSRGIAPLSRNERLILLGIVLAAWALFHEGTLLLIALVLGFRCFTGAQGEGDREALTQFGLLIAALGLLSTIRTGL
jgi:Zn-dependent protease